MSDPARQHRRALPEASARRGWCPGLARAMPTGDGLLVRLHPPLGILTPNQARAIADGARRFGNGHLDLTARANLQIRGVTEPTREDLASVLNEAGLGDVRTDGGPQRLTLTAPLAGYGPGELIDVPALARAIEEAGRTVERLPPKTLVVVAGRPGVALPEADLHVSARSAGTVGLAVAGPNGMHDLAVCTERDAPSLIVTLLEAFVRTGARRIRDLAGAQRQGLVDALRLDGRARTASSNERAGRDGAVAPGASFVPSAGPVSIGACRRALVLDAPFGRCTADALDRIAALAEGTGTGEIRLSPARGFVLVADLDRVAVAALDAFADTFIVTRDDPRRGIEACTGAPGCASGSTATLADAARLAEPFGPFAAGGRTLHVSGCAKGCAHPGPADLTLVGHGGRYGVTVGGAPGDEPAIDLPIEAVLKRLGRAKIVGLAAAFARNRANPEDHRDGRPA